MTEVKKAPRPRRQMTAEQKKAARERRQLREENALELRLQREVEAAQAARSAQLKKIEQSFIFGFYGSKPIFYRAGRRGKKLVGPARRAYDVISTYYAAAIRTDHEAALELAEENAMKIIGQLPVTIRTDDELLIREVSAASFQLGLSFLKSGLKWLAECEEKERTTDVA